MPTLHTSMSRDTVSVGVFFDVGEPGFTMFANNAWASSGGMYSGVKVRPSNFCTLPVGTAPSRSMSFHVGSLPPSNLITFLGLMSKCTNPKAWRPQTMETRVQWSFRSSSVDKVLPSSPLLLSMSASDSSPISKMRKRQSSCASSPGSPSSVLDQSSNCTKQSRTSNTSTNSFVFFVMMTAESWDAFEAARPVSRSSTVTAWTMASSLTLKDWRCELSVLTLHSVILAFFSLPLSLKIASNT
mmetsp:Transcript_49404/g.150328  ORF Transcript_49404/g.150328 Transcript_49404/m.150328 type:complete len:242 (-) Transcript_49404:209-934(-)